jgi:hypothetical protein
MAAFWKGFFWGEPSHKRIAWLGMLAGLGVIALAAVVQFFGKGVTPLFALAILFVGLAEFGWGIELLPRQWRSIAGWGRAARWLCALFGAGIAGVSLLSGGTPLRLFEGIILVTGVLLAIEMAPRGPANRPK